MDFFRRLATFTIARDASFVALAASTLMLAFSFNPPLAFFIGANVALAFAIVLILRSWRLTGTRILQTEAWRVLHRHERPRSEHERHLAWVLLDTLFLRTAKAATMAAIVLSSLSLIVSAGTPQSPSVMAERGTIIQSSITR